MAQLATYQEEDLLQQLAGLERRIARSPTGRDRGSRSALSFLRELRRDRQEVLQKLRVRGNATGHRR